jgi:predicted DNA-binding antitoxin AbrB/MazE fold protein
MNQIEAIYQGGVFKPLKAIGLKENQHVRLMIQPIEDEDIANWLAQMQERQRETVAKRGFYPDTTSDIAEDRLR